MQLPGQSLDGGDGLEDLGVDIQRAQAGPVRARTVLADFRLQLQAWIEQPYCEGLEEGHRMLLAGYAPA
jgi:hypothetical protein